MKSEDDLVMRSLGENQREDHRRVDSRWEPDSEGLNRAAEQIRSAVGDCLLLRMDLLAMGRENQEKYGDNSLLETVLGSCEGCCATQNDCDGISKESS